MPRVPPSRPAVAIAVVVGLLAASAVGASVVVARIGERELTVADVQGVIDRTPPYQLRFQGKDHGTIRRAVLDQLVLGELLAEAAVADNLAAREDVRERMRNIMREALLDQLRSGCRPESFSEEEVKAYYNAHADLYAPRKRIKMSRILLPSREAALEVIAELDNAPASERVQRWRDLARERSADQATNKRAGDLDMVEADGSTPNKSLTVDPALFAAAAKLADGAFGKEPVADGDAWSVIWRRTGYDTPLRELKAESSNIRRELARAKLERDVGVVVERLKDGLVEDYHPELVDKLDVDAFGEVSIRTRPGLLPRLRHAAARSPGPMGEPGHLH